MKSARPVIIKLPDRHLSEKLDVFGVNLFDVEDEGRVRCYEVRKIMALTVLSPFSWIDLKRVGGRE